MKHYWCGCRRGSGRRCRTRYFFAGKVVATGKCQVIDGHSTRSGKRLNRVLRSVWKQFPALIGALNKATATANANFDGLAALARLH